MPISQETFARKRPGTRWNPDKHVWSGYRIDVRVNGKRYRNGPFPTRRDAEIFVEQLKIQASYKRAGIRSPAAARAITIRQLADRRIESHGERKQLELEKRVLNYFCELVGENTRVEEITVSHFRSFIEKRGKELTVRGVPVKPQTVDREIAIIAAMLHNAGKHFDELENYRAPKIPRPKFRKGRRERVITDEEKQSILKALYSIDGDAGRIFEFATLTGLRHSEIMQLRKTDLDRSSRSLKVYRSKTDTTSYISPLTARMLELLRSHFDGPFIFTADGKTPSLFYQRIRKACEECGISYGRFTDGGVILHDARHTFVTRLQQAGIDLATIQSFSGHSSRELVMRYSHARPESRQRAMDAIEGSQNVDGKLLEIFEKVSSGAMNFEQFVKALNWAVAGFSPKKKEASA